MSYPTIQPPFTLVFREMPKKELKDYNEWFHKVMGKLIGVSQHFLTQTLLA